MESGPSRMTRDEPTNQRTTWCGWAASGGRIIAASRFKSFHTEKNLTMRRMKSYSNFIRRQRGVMSAAPSSPVGGALLRSTSQNPAHLEDSRYSNRFDPSQ
jgi:hypothetical protein